MPVFKPCITSWTWLCCLMSLGLSDWKKKGKFHRKWDSLDLYSFMCVEHQRHQLITAPSPGRKLIMWEKNHLSFFHNLCCGVVELIQPWAPQQNLCVSVEAWKKNCIYIFFFVNIYTLYNIYIINIVTIHQGSGFWFFKESFLWLCSLFFEQVMDYNQFRLSKALNVINLIFPFVIQTGQWFLSIGN